MTRHVTDLRYPIGRFTAEENISAERREELFAEIERAPALLRAAAEGLSPEQLDTPYRPGGWTVRQVLHHVPESHLNAFLRFKLALTEDQPTIKPYDEDAWAHLDDVRATPVEASLDLLESLHRRWLYLLRTMNDEQFGRTFWHPEHGKAFRLDTTLAIYAWHGKHHAAHITTLREREGW